MNSAPKNELNHEKTNTVIKTEQYLIKTTKRTIKKVKPTELFKQNFTTK